MAKTGAEAAMAPSTMWGYLSLSHAAKGCAHSEGKQAGNARKNEDGSISRVGVVVFVCPMFDELMRRESTQL